MHIYLHMQEAPITDNITDEGHVGSGAQCASWKEI